MKGGGSVIAASSGDKEAPGQVVRNVKYHHHTDQVANYFSTWWICHCKKEKKTWQWLPWFQTSWRGSGHEMFTLANSRTQPRGLFPCWLAPLSPCIHKWGNEEETTWWKWRETASKLPLW